MVYSVAEGYSIWQTGLLLTALELLQRLRSGFLFPPLSM